MESYGSSLGPSPREATPPSGIYDRFTGVIGFIIKKTWYSNKMRFLFFFFIALFFINILLIYNNKMVVGNDAPVDDSKASRAKFSLENSLYLSTTQLTTMGYGDITPKSGMPKIIVSVIHMIIAFIALNLASEYGANNTQKDMIENALTRVISMEERKRRRTMVGEELQSHIAKGLASEVPIAHFDDVVNVNEKAADVGSFLKRKSIDIVNKTRARLENNRRQASVLPVSTMPYSLSGNGNNNTGEFASIDTVRETSERSTSSSSEEPLVNGDNLMADPLE